MPHGGWALWRKELTVVIRVMQSSSNGLSSSVSDNVKM